MSEIITIKLELTDEFLMDCMTNAVESGGHALWYWEQFRMESVNRDSELNVTDMTFMAEDQDGEVHRYTITPAKVANAIQKILSLDLIASDIQAMIQRGVKDNDGGDIDAIAADCIAQIACFGELVYG